METLARLGVTPVINVAGPATRLGGAVLPCEVVAAMNTAAACTYSMVHLEAAASRAIAAHTGAEAGYVTSGAFAALTLAAAAVMAGLDVPRMDRLPDAAGMRNEFIIAREQRNGYDHALRVAGGRLVEVGMNERGAGAGVRQTEAWEYAAAINDRTAALVYFATAVSRPPLAEVVAVARAHDLPLIVDAANQLPPAANLRRFVEAGADLVAFSGGKAIRGPQSTGILCGRRDLIASVALQHLDMDEYLAIWDAPADFIDVATLPGLPRHGIGRGFKVAKEEVVGLLEALRLFTTGGYAEHYRACAAYVEQIAAVLSRLPGVATRISRPDGPGYAMLYVTLDAAILGRDAFAVAARLKHDTPPVYVGERSLYENTLTIHPINLDAAATETVMGALVAALS